MAAVMPILRTLATGMLDGLSIALLCACVVAAGLVLGTLVLAVVVVGIVLIVPAGLALLLILAVRGLARCR
jgi:hypothetical protein